MKGRIVMKITNKKIGRLIAGLMICSSLLATPLSVFAEGTDSSKEEKTETLKTKESGIKYIDSDFLNNYESNLGAFST